MDHLLNLTDISVMSLSPEGLQDHPSQIKTHRRKGSTGRIELPTLTPLPSSLAYDMR